MREVKVEMQKETKNMEKEEGRMERWKRSENHVEVGREK
jgi:hypothetical protein